MCRHNGVVESWKFTNLYKFLGTGRFATMLNNAFGRLDLASEKMGIEYRSEVLGSKDGYINLKQILEQGMKDGDI